MGGSAIGGDLVRTLAAATAPVPFAVVRDYTLPAWVCERTLVVASSYSGGTEETLSGYAEATAPRRARRRRDVGRRDRGERAAADGFPVVTIPGGLQPRAALGYSLGAVLRLARALGLLALPDADFDGAVAEARARADRHDADDDANPARALSEAYLDRLPGRLHRRGAAWRPSGCAGGRRSTRTPSTRPSATSSPSWTTTRSWASRPARPRPARADARRGPPRPRRPPAGAEALRRHARARRRATSTAGPRSTTEGESAARAHAVARAARRRGQLLARDAQGRQTPRLSRPSSRSRRRSVD